MTEKKATKKAVPRKSAAKKPATGVKRKTSTSRTKRAATNKVDYYPNRVALFTATTAVLILLVLGMITAL